ncbi:MAG: hypothetical protein WBA15_03335 [Mesorhizobium sp.]|jgi:hypothetical protein
MQIHQRGVDLLVNVLDAADNLDSLTREEMRDLLNEVGIVLGSLLERDIPVAGLDSSRLETSRWRREDN